MTSASSSLAIPNTSPLISYTGGPGSSVWTTWFSISGLLNSEGEFGAGQSFHNSSTVGSSFWLSFNGTGISLAGIATCGYSIDLDGKTFSGSASNGALFEAHSLSGVEHTINLTITSVEPSQQLAFSSAAVTFPTSPNSPSQGLRIDNSNTSIIRYGPSASDWTSSTVPHVPSESAAPFIETKSQSSFAELDFVGSAVAITGFLTSGHGGYFITIDGNARRTLEGTSQWLIGNAILYHESGLSDSHHTIRITNSPDGWGSALSINSFIIWGTIGSTTAATNITVVTSVTTSSTLVSSSPGSSPATPVSSLPWSSPAALVSSLPASAPTMASSLPVSKVSHAGIIAGGTIGGIVALGLIIVALFACLRSRKRNRILQDREPLPYTIPPESAAAVPQSMMNLAAPIASSGKLPRMPFSPPSSSSQSSSPLSRPKQGPPSAPNESAPSSISTTRETQLAEVARLLTQFASELPPLPAAVIHDEQHGSHPPPAYGT